MPITKITPPICDLLRNELNTALAAVAKKHGLNIVIGRMAYQATNVKIPLEVSLIAEDGNAMTKEAQAFQMFAESSFHMKKADLWKNFTVKGTEYQLIGAKLRTKYPMQAKRISDGAVFGFPSITVRKAMGYEVTREELLAAL